MWPLRDGGGHLDHCRLRERRLLLDLGCRCPVNLLSSFWTFAQQSISVIKDVALHSYSGDSHTMCFLPSSSQCSCGAVYTAWAIKRCNWLDQPELLKCYICADLLSESIPRGFPRIPVYDGAIKLQKKSLLPNMFCKTRRVNGATVWRSTDTIIVQSLVPQIRNL